MTNKDVLEGIACPKCKSEGPFDIVGEAVFLRVTDDGCADFCEMAWSGKNSIECIKCKHKGMVQQFKKLLYVVVVKDVDVDLLREQRDYLVELTSRIPADELIGVVHLLDNMLDYAEGFKDG